ncbi:MAG: SdrD B-like domain-containing protein [Chloroflexota bacterium]
MFRQVINVRFLFLLVFLQIFLSTQLFFANTVYAATFDVDTTIDDAALTACTAADADCSLRGAIIAANADTDADTINLPAGLYVLTVMGSDDATAVGDLDITRDLTITGAGPAQTIISGQSFLGSNADRVFHFRNSTTDVHINGLTVVGGYHGSRGAQIYNNAGGFVELNNVVLRGAVGFSTGAPIVNFGTSCSSSSPFACHLRIRNSAILGHYGSNTGAVRNMSDERILELINVTIANTTHGSYDTGNHNGAIRIEAGTAVLTNTTVFNNRHGIDIEDGASATLYNTLLVNNGDDMDGRNCRVEGTGVITSAGGNYSSDATCSMFTATGDVNNGGDPGLSDLTYESGQIVVPAYANSTILNSAPSNCPAEDQVGMARASPAGCTIGAYEGFVMQLTVSVPSLTANTIKGVTFRDYNANGVRDLYEPPVTGISVTAYLNDHTIVSQETSGADGVYRLTVTDTEQVRVEFSEWSERLAPGAMGSNMASTVRFVESPTNTLDLPLSDAGRYCQSNPSLVTSCYVRGEQDANRDVLVTFDYLSGASSFTDDPVNGFTQEGNANGLWNYDLPAHPTIANDSDIGTTWGLAYQRSSGRLFTAAFLKRHAGFGPNGPGAIYQITPTVGIGSATLLLDLGLAAGTDPHPIGTDFGLDSASWPLVGQSSLGDMDISDDDQTLYVTNLADRALYRIPITNPSAHISITVPLTLPNATQGCVQDDVRPFGIGINNDTTGETVYVGMVCTAATTQLTSNLRAYVYAFDTASNQFGTTPTLEFALDYAHGHALSNDYPLSGKWRPWLTGTVPTDILNIEQVNATTFFTRAVYPQPMLADIDFIDTDTGKRDMVLAFMDRLGHQVAPDEDLPNGDAGNADDNLTDVEPAGDIIRACMDNNGTWVIEANGTCGSVTTAGAQNNEGLGGGEYYFEDQLYSYHPEAVIGGLLQLPGQSDVAYIAYDPVIWSRDLNSAGVHWASNQYGTWQRGYRIYDNLGGSTDFAKANGLGDLEALCEAAPIEIGNRVWLDADRDGLQDAHEQPLAGVVVNLLATDGTTVLGTAVTDTRGHYLFSSDTAQASTTSAIYSLSTLQPNTAGYRLQIETPSGYELTVIQTGSDSRNSDAVVLNNKPSITVNTGASGDNDHTFDIGFVPEIVDLAIIKQAAPTTVNAGSYLTYTLTYSNLLTSAVENITITDFLPTDVTFLGQLTNDPSATLDSGNPAQPTWAVSSLLTDTTGIIRFLVAVDANYSGLLTNTVSITTSKDITLTNNQFTITTTVLYETLTPSLIITKSPPTQTIQSGEDAQFTITLANNGTSALTSVTVTDTFASDCNRTLTNFVVNQTTQYMCTMNALTASLVNTVLAEGMDAHGNVAHATDSAHVTVTVKPITITVPTTATIINTMTVPTTVTVHNTVTVQIPVEILVNNPVETPVYVPITTTVTLTEPVFVTTTVILTETVYMTNTVINTVINTVTNTITNIMPITVLKIITTTVTVTRPVIVTQTAPITVFDSITVLQSIPTLLTVPNLSVNPTNTVTETSTQETGIQETPALILRVSDNDAAIVPGGILIYTLVYENEGTAESNDVMLTMFVPEYTYFDAEISTSGWHCPNGRQAGQSCTFELAQLPPGEYGFVLFVVHLLDDLDMNSVTEISVSGMIAGTDANGEIIVTGNAHNHSTPILQPTAITIVSFMAEAIQQSMLNNQPQIVVSWQTGVEFDIDAFRLFRGDSPDRRGAVLVNSEPVVARGDYNEYQFEDSVAEVTEGQTYFYWLTRINSHGSVDEIGPIAVVVNPPQQNVYLPWISR